MEAALLERIVAGSILAGFLFLVLLWGKGGVWVWARELDAAHARADAAEERARRAEKEGADWRRMALEGLGVADHVVQELDRNV